MLLLDSGSALFLAINADEAVDLSPDSVVMHDASDVEDSPGSTDGTPTFVADGQISGVGLRRRGAVCERLKDSTFAGFPESVMCSSTAHSSQ